MNMSSINEHKKLAGFSHASPVNAQYSLVTNGDSRLIPQDCGCGCGGSGVCQCNSGELNAPVSEQATFAIGKLKIYFSSEDKEREFITAAQSLDIPLNAPLSLTNSDYYTVFSYEKKLNNNANLICRPYYYLAQDACWVLSIGEVDSYFLKPDSSLILDSLINALNTKQQGDTVSVIGLKRGNAPLPYCKGLQLPILQCSQISNSKKDNQNQLSFKTNPGNTDVERAINYLSINFDDIVNVFSLSKQAFIGLNYQFSSSHPERTVVDIILTFLLNDIETMYLIGVDVTNLYPFIATPLQHYSASA